MLRFKLDWVEYYLYNDALNIYHEGEVAHRVQGEAVLERYFAFSWMAVHICENEI